MKYQLNYDLIFSEGYFGRLLGGAEITVLLFFISLAASFIVGMLLAAVRSSSFKPAQLAIAAFVEYQRNVPLLVHLLVWYFGIASIIPRGLSDFANRHSAEFFYALITLSLYGAAFISEDLRSGFRAIPKTQYESARSIGLSFVLMMRLVILPQAMRNALPPIINQALSLYKNTSIAAVIGVAELMYRSREIATETFRVFEIFSIVTVVYTVGSLILIAVGYGVDRWLEIPGKVSR